MGTIAISSPVRRLGITAALTKCSLRTCTGDGSEVLKKASDVVENVLTLAGLRNHRVIRAYRDIMWRLGIDPTKVRPSSEALARRVLRRKGVRSITQIVDSCNAASLVTLVVISVFDASKISPPLTLRFAREGEVFRDFSGKERVLTGKEIVLTDSDRKILHLYPYRDSATAAVSEGTKEIIAIAYGAPGVGISQLLKALSSFREYLTILCEGVVCSDTEVAR